MKSAEAKKPMFVIDGSSLLCWNKEQRAKDQLWRDGRAGRLTDGQVSGDWVASVKPPGRGLPDPVIHVNPLHPNWWLVANLIEYCIGSGFEWLLLFDAPARFWLEGADRRASAQGQSHSFVNELNGLRTRYPNQVQVVQRGTQADHPLLYFANLHHAEQKHEVFIVSHDKFKKRGEREMYASLFCDTKTGGSAGSPPPGPRVLLCPSPAFNNEAFFRLPGTLGDFSLPWDRSLASANSPTRAVHGGDQGRGAQGMAVPALDRVGSSKHAPVRPMERGRVTAALERAGPRSPQSAALFKCLWLTWDNAHLKLDSARMAAAAMAASAGAWPRIVLGVDDPDTPNPERILTLTELSVGQFKYVSRDHLLLEREGTDVWMTDTSTNGTYLNGKRLPRGQRVRLGPPFSENDDDGSAPGSIALCGVGADGEEYAILLNFEFLTLPSASEGRPTQPLPRSFTPPASAPQAAREPGAKDSGNYVLHVQYEDGRESFALDAAKLRAPCSVGNGQSNSAPADLSVKLGAKGNACVGVSGHHLNISLLAGQSHIFEVCDQSTNHTYVIEGEREVQMLSSGERGYLKLANLAFDPRAPHLRLSKTGTDAGGGRKLSPVWLWVTGGN